MEILVRSPNWIGDCIMSLSSLRALKYYFPDAVIGLTCREHLQAIFKNISEIDRIIPLKNGRGVRDFSRVVSQLKTLNSDVGILMTNSIHSALLFKFSGIKKIVGYRKDFRGFLLDQKLKFPRGQKRQSDFYLDLIHAFAREYSSVSIQAESHFSGELPILDQEINDINKLLGRYGIDAGKKLVGISTSAAYGSSKEWLPERFIELINRLTGRFPDTVVLLLGSESEARKIEWIRQQSTVSTFNLAGKFSLRESITAISRCSLFISNDSGLMHVASALKVPLICKFGPTDPDKTAPWFGQSKIIYHPVECAPCTYRECPVDHRCMTGIQVDEVFRTVLDILDRGQENWS